MVAIPEDSTPVTQIPATEYGPQTVTFNSSSH